MADGVLEDEFGRSHDRQSKSLSLSLCLSSLMEFIIIYKYMYRHLI